MRFHRHLTAALDINGNPHPVLRPFAVHLEKHLIGPSHRYAGSVHTSGPFAGCLTYEPPDGVTWAD